MLYAYNENLLAENQLGFVAGNRTSDAHIIVNNPLSKRLAIKTILKYIVVLLILEKPWTPCHVIFF